MRKVFALSERVVLAIIDILRLAITLVMGRRRF
jgi:hypothetical protein